MNPNDVLVPQFSLVTFNARWRQGFTAVPLIVAIAIRHLHDYIYLTRKGRLATYNASHRKIKSRLCMYREK